MTGRSTLFNVIIYICDMFQQNESYVSELDFEKTPHKHATMIFDDFDFLSPKYTLVSFFPLAMFISRLYYYLVHFIAFLDTLRYISRMNFVKENR